MTAIKVASFGEAVNVTLGLPFPAHEPPIMERRSILPGREARTREA